MGGHSFHSRFGDLEIHGPDVCTNLFSFAYFCQMSPQVLWISARIVLTTELLMAMLGVSTNGNARGLY